MLNYIGITTTNKYIKYTINLCYQISWWYSHVINIPLVKNATWLWVSVHQCSRHDGSMLNYLRVSIRWNHYWRSTSLINHGLDHGLLIRGWHRSLTHSHVIRLWPYLILNYHCLGLSNLGLSRNAWYCCGIRFEPSIFTKI